MLNKKRILAVSLSSIVLFSSATQVFARNLENQLENVKDEINTQNSDIDKYKNDIENNKNKIQKLDTDINLIKEKKGTSEEKINELNTLIQRNLDEIYEVENKIQSTENEINKLNLDIEKANADIEFNMDLLKKRIHVMYKLGEVSKMQILLNASSINDFLSRNEMMTSLTESDQRLIRNLRESKDRLSSLKKSLDEKKEELEKSKEDLENKKKSLEEQKKYHAELLEQLKKEETNKSYAISELSRAVEEYEKVLNKKREENSSLLEKKKNLETEIARIEAEAIERQRREEEERENSVDQSDLNSKRDELEEVNRRVESSRQSRLLWPSSATYVSSPFGWRGRPIYGGLGFHHGVDIAGPYNTPIYAAEDGVVEAVNHMWGEYGNTIIINHGNGIKTLYAHLNGFLVSEGQRVTRGDHIAKMGSTGYSTGSHLHFEVRINGTRVDPMDYIR